MVSMTMREAPEGTDCECVAVGCSCENDADLVRSDGTAICGCCFAECPDVHDQHYVVVVRAVPSSRGWELHVDDVGVTRVSDLSDARERARSLLETAGYAEASSVRVVVSRPAAPPLPNAHLRPFSARDGT